MFESEWWLGRRFQFVDKSAPDMTVVGGDPKNGRLRVHSTDGTRSWLPWDEMMTAVQMGILEESSLPPFVWDRAHDAAADLRRALKRGGVYSVAARNRRGDHVVVKFR